MCNMQRLVAHVIAVLSCIFLNTASVSADILLANFGTDEILRYDETGAPKGVFASGGGLDGPGDIVIGPDGNSYVSAIQTNGVLRYDGTTGSFIDTFIDTSSGMNSPRGLVFHSEPIPEPSTLVILGGLGIGLIARLPSRITDPFPAPILDDHATFC